MCLIIKKNFGNKVVRVSVALMKYDCGDGNDNEGDDNEGDDDDDDDDDSNEGDDDDNSLTPSVFAII